MTEPSKIKTLGINQVGSINNDEVNVQGDMG
jgi:hypothetical protein